MCKIQPLISYFVHANIVFVHRNGLLMGLDGRPLMGCGLGRGPGAWAHLWAVEGSIHGSSSQSVQGSWYLKMLVDSQTSWRTGFPRRVKYIDRCSLGNQLGFTI